MQEGLRRGVFATEPEPPIRLSGVNAVSASATHRLRANGGGPPWRSALGALVAAPILAPGNGDRGGRCAGPDERPRWTRAQSWPAWRLSRTRSRAWRWWFPDQFKSTHRALSSPVPGVAQATPSRWPVGVCGRQLIGPIRANRRARQTPCAPQPGSQLEGLFRDPPGHARVRSGRANPQHRRRATRRWWSCWIGRTARRA